MSLGVEAITSLAELRLATRPSILTLSPNTPQYA